jgi:hypothetical protein
LLGLPTRHGIRKIEADGIPVCRLIQRSRLRAEADRQDAAAHDDAGDSRLGGGIQHVAGPDDIDLPEIPLDLGTSAQPEQRFHVKDRVDAFTRRA